MKQTRYFVRISASGRPVEGSLLVRATKPKDGRWADITTCIGQCCASQYSTLEIPTNFAASVGSPATTKINLAWDAVTGADAYVVEQSTSSTFASGVSTIYTGTGTSTIATGLTTGTHYYFRIHATGNGFGNSSHGYADRSTT